VKSRNAARCLLLLAAFLSLPISTEAQVKSIKLRNETISTAPGRKEASADQWPGSGRSFSGLFLIQFESGLQLESRQQLASLGVELLRYVPDDTFIARATNTRLQEVRALAFVRWVGEYKSEHKFHGALRRRAQEKIAGETVAVSVLLAAGAAPAHLASARGLLQKIDQESRLRAGTVLRGRIASARLQALAESHAVLWIEPAPKMKLLDETASKIVAGDAAPHVTVVQEYGFDGAGVRVAVADSGLHTGEADTMHPDLFGRVDAFFYYGDLTNAADEHSHGTHVTGIIAGDGTLGETDEFDALYGLGVAPRAHIIAQRIFDGEGGYQEPPSFETLTRDAVGAGADIGSNSWGDDTQGRYDISAMEFDELVRDADALALDAQPYILEFSAGNAGPGTQTIWSPAVAKNVIATGASQNNRFNLPIEELPTYDTGQETLADFSSRGPCEDGRIKPDVVAPGTWIASLRSEYANDDFAWWPISDFYMYQGGTSQAGPHVSGLAAVFVQYWRASHSGQTPSPALVKAALINSAVDMDNSIETGPTPNMDEGWGRADLTQIIGSTRRYEFVDQSTLLLTGQTYEQRVLVDDPEEPLKITLVYTDMPGFPGAVPALVNDLDLEVIGPDGARYRGNQFEDGESIANASVPDAINNVEAVHLLAPMPGEYLLRVRARNVPQDSRAETSAVDQDFALVVSGRLAPPGTGIVAFDRRDYTAPSLMRLTLFDQNLAGQATAPLTLQSTTESSGEIILLQAVGASGVFTASVAVATGPALANGRLEVSHGDLIEAIYQDANPPATRRYTAQADLLPPNISNVAASYGFGAVTITWNTDEDTRGIVRYGTNTLTLSRTNRFLDTFQEVSLAAIVPNVPYHYLVIAEDSAGNRATNDNGGALYTFQATQTPAVLVVDAYNNDLFAVPPLSGYTDALAQLGVGYEVWDTEVNGAVPENVLPRYRCVIWRVPEFSLGTTWSATDARAVTNYLRGGGSLLIASMELLSRLEEASMTSFARDVLQVQSFVADAGAPHIAGAPGEAIGSGINLTLDYTLYEDEIKEFIGIPTDASDSLTATTNASPILLNGSAVVGVRSPKPGRDLPGRVVYLSFPLDAVPMGTEVGNNRLGLVRDLLNFLVPPEGNSTLTLDSDVYTVPGLATVEVEDPDLTGQGSTSVRCYSPQETNGLVITLSETSRRGLFRGTIPLAVINQASAPKLVVRAGDTFRVEYLDTSAGRLMSASAMIETIAPMISNVSFEEGYVDALIVWETSEATDALVQYSESPGTNFPVNFTAYSPNPEVLHELILERLKPSQTYYFRVVSSDRAGNVAISQVYSFTTLTPLFSPWTNDLEHARADDWTVVTPNESELVWRLGVPNNGASAFSPVQAWGTSLNADVAGAAETVLLSPATYLTGGERILLRFAQNYEFASTANFEEIEYGEIRLYTNLATAPITLGTITDSSSGWEEVEFDLTRYREQLVYIGWYYFLFSFDSAPRFGWLLDDISVTVSNIVPGTIRITNNLWQARYFLAGPRSRFGQGASLLMTNALPGQYRITFGDVRYYQTPPPQTNTLDSLQTLVFEGNYTMIDSNHNGMADAWEQQNFGQVSPTRTQQTDTDNDGFTDYAEFIAGTNPQAITSKLTLGTPQRLSDGSRRLEWPSVSGRAYRLEGSADGVSWESVSGWIRAASSTTAFTLPPTTGAGPYLFRLEVRP
jgi:hypothetical protein